MSTQYILSPKFSHDKLANPSNDDLIDVLEDVWQGYVFAQVDLMLQSPHGDVAAMALLSSYFEAAWIYATGEGSVGKSQVYFVKGFLLAFRSNGPGAGGIEDEIVAKAIYKHVRCGLAHTGMVSFRVNYSRSGSKAFFVTYPKRSDGTLDLTEPLRSIVVNPVRMFEGARQHFTRYIAKLRSGEDRAVLYAFRKAASSLWGLGEPDNVIGMGEDEFFGRS